MAGGEAVILSNLTFPDGSRADIRLADGRIDGIGSFPPGEDLSGYLILPAPVEPHAHLDKAYSADLVPNPTGDLWGAVKGWLAHRPTLSEQDISLRAGQALRAYLAHGATVVRTHVDVGDDIGLRGLHAIAGLDGVQVVAFGANPLSGVEGARNRALLRDAIAAGADAIGACPAHDPDPRGCIDAVLALAAGKVPVDMHIDESLDPEPCTLSLLADAATGFGHQVVASHCVSLGMMPPPRMRRIVQKVAQARIAVVCLPQTNLYLQGRDNDTHATSPPRGLTAMRALREAGVTVAAGGDNLQDPFNLVGRADPLETAALLILAGHDTPENAYAAVSNDARRAMGLPEVTLRPGAPADLLAIRAKTPREAIATANPERVVIRGGRIVARTTLKTDWPKC
ncbi:MAG TPA: amidohydrolase family protein [Candidatus Limnocylindrales bacterium]|nr:amidohydrolase family protein [Candidatus Limnocylindrales bacterium]